MNGITQGLLVLDGFLETKLMKLDTVALTKCYPSIKPIEGGLDHEQYWKTQISHHSQLIEKEKTPVFQQAIDQFGQNNV